MTRTPSTRAQLITRRTYNRPLEDGTFETWAQTIDRCIGHQKWLWERAQRKALTFGQAEELDELRDLLLDRKVGLSGRTLWLGGTEIAKGRELSQFNCAGLVLSTIHDYVDMVWGLLNGVGVGFHPRPGSINGFQKPVKQIIVKRSERTLAQWEAGERGREHNVETWEPLTRTWTISIGDSAAAWAKSIGKLLAGKYPADTLVIDLREIRAAGMRLRGYGWISSGDQTLSVATEAIARIMSRKAGQLLSFANLHDIANWCGTILSTRRSAQIALCDYNTPDWREFAKFKKDYWVTGNNQRSQSNNSLVFWETPTKPQLTEIFQMMLDAGGSEPGFINGVTAKARAPWFAAFNPCFSGDTLIATSEGAFPIEQLVGKTVTLWDGDQWTTVDNFRVTGENQPLLRFTLGDGAEVKVTPYHTMVLEDGTKLEARHVKVGDQLRRTTIAYSGDLATKMQALLTSDARVASVDPAGVADKVYCCTVPTNNLLTTALGVVTGNCVEILLADKGFCNLVNINLGAFKDDPAGLLRATYLISRANYRQTCVDLRDGVLQEAWHQNNNFLRLCGVSLTGQAMRPDLTAYDYRTIKNEAICGANSMAVELDMPRPKNVTCGKPEGTLSKCMDATEGAHTPLAKYIFNNVVFSRHDPLVPLLRAANYTIFDHPSSAGDVVIALPVAWEGVEFTKVGDIEVNVETALDQLEHYKMLMDNFVEQNQSVTISYDPSEVPTIIDWLLANWDHYVGVSFLLRADPTKTAADLGYPYLPQQPVTREQYEGYVATLLPVNLEQDTGEAMLAIEDCSTGACPIR